MKDKIDERKYARYKSSFTAKLEDKAKKQTVSLEKIPEEEMTLKEMLEEFGIKPGLIKTFSIMLKQNGYDIDTLKLPRPIVSEEEIESFMRKSLQVVKINANQVALVDFKEYILYEATVQAMILAIKELLNR